MGILPEPPFNFRQICDHQPKSGDSCLKSPFNLWPDIYLDSYVVRRKHSLCPMNPLVGRNTNPRPALFTVSTCVPSQVTASTGDMERLSGTVLSSANLLDDEERKKLTVGSIFKFNRKEANALEWKAGPFARFISDRLKALLTTTHVEYPQRSSSITAKRKVGRLC